MVAISFTLNLIFMSSFLHILQQLIIEVERQIELPLPEEMKQIRINVLNQLNQIYQLEEKLINEID